jgi:DNA polymerase elongation subunit (family B)
VYPSTIRAFNIGYNTFNPLGSLVIDDEHKFLDPGEEKSWTVQILDEIEPLLDENKRQLNEAKKAGDQRLVARLKARRLGLKAIVHGNYGFYGFKGNIEKGLPAARLFSIKIAEAITAVPRTILKEGIPEIVEELGYTVVYGDTDSIYLPLKTNDVRKEATELKDKLQDKVRAFIRNKWDVDPSPFVLDLEDIFKTIIFLAKKRYTGETIDGIRVNKGIEIVRRDQSKLTEETQSGLISLILSNQVEKIPAFLREQIKKVDSYSLDKIGIPAILKKRVDDFKTSSVHLKAFIFSRDYLDIPLAIGERFYYVYIHPVSVKARIKIKNKWRYFTPEAVAFSSPEQVKEVMEMKMDGGLLDFLNMRGKARVKIKVDREAMIEKTIRRKVEDFLKLINIEWEDIADRGMS